MKRTCVERFDFRGAYAPPLTASRLGKWAKADTSAAGSPTVQTGSSGAMELTLVNTNEAENLCLYYGDVLPYDIDDLVRFEMWVAVTASLNAAISAAWGLTGARNDAIDSIAQAALFRVIGNNNVVVESDDGTNDNDDVATGETLSTTFKRFVIDFSAGNLAQSPPSRSLGGTADVRFHIGNSAGLLRRVAAGTRFNMSNYTGGLQPFFQIQKTADAATGVLYVLGGEIEYRLPL